MPPRCALSSVYATVSREIEPSWAAKLTHLGIRRSNALQLGVDIDADPPALVRFRYLKMLVAQHLYQHLGRIGAN